jgi:hypothetical protein
MARIKDLPKHKKEKKKEKKGGNLFDQKIIVLSHGETERLSQSGRGDHVWIVAP